MKPETILLAGGAGLALLYLYKNGTTALPATGVTTAGAPAPPASWNQAYYLTYQYPAMLAANPNVGNPAYTLTPAEATQYYNNYLELQQWATTVVPKVFPSIHAAMQYHWKTYGVPLKYSFMPFTPPKNANWVPPPVNANASSSSSSWLSDAIKVAGSVAVALIAGIGDNQVSDPLLNNKEVEVIITGSDIGLSLLPMYYGEPGGLAFAIEDKVKQVLNQYTK